MLKILKTFTMPHLQIRNVPDDLHLALKTWAKEKNSSISALILNQLQQQVQLRAFEQSLWKLPITDTPQDTVSSLHAGRNE